MMEFECKLAHCAERKRLTNFNSVKEFYEKVSQAFSIPSSEVSSTDVTSLIHLRLNKSIHCIKSITDPLLHLEYTQFSRHELYIDQLSVVRRPDRCSFVRPGKGGDHKKNT